jgi:transcriptional regulator with XRE-family HTH domain
LHYKTQHAIIGHKGGGGILDIGKRIKRARLEKGYTQEALADMVGVKKSAVAKWENGRVSEIKRSNLNMLSKALGINPNSLLDDIAENPVKTAERHIEILMDEDISEIFDYFQKMDKRKRQIVKDLAKSLAETEA